MTTPGPAAPAEVTAPVLEQVDSAVESTEGVYLRRVADDTWERRSAQVWYRIRARSEGPAEDLRVHVEAGLVVPLLARIVPDLVTLDELTIGGNLLHLDLTEPTPQRVYNLVPGTRRGKFAARLRAPVLGHTDARQVTVGQPFVDDLRSLLQARVAPLVHVANWSDVAGVLVNSGESLVSRQLCPPPYLGIAGVLYWAAGRPDHARQLLRPGFEPARRESVEARLAERFPGS
ncbi:MAG: hypothetical protein ACK5MT_11375 [Actinomycetales bacterium]